MCDAVGELFRLGVSRRRFIRGVTAAAGGATLLSAAQAAAGTDENPTRRPMTAAEVAGNYACRLVLLGTAGGPTWHIGREGTASALIVDDRIYLVDCGEGVGKQLMLAQQAGLDPRQETSPVPPALEKLRAVFLTHLHSDHTIDYFNLFLYGWYQGLTDVKQPIQVFGPGNRGELEPLFNSKGAQPPVINPGNPTPGTVEMTDYLYQAYATDINDRMRDNHRPDLHKLIEVHDIPLPEIDTFKTPNTTPAPPMQPFSVWEDDRVRVSATLVNHAPIFPSFAFRFDTDQGSVVFSGDTSPCDNLIRMARGADILVHEVIDMDFINNIFPKPWNEQQESLIHHLQAAHTTIDDVGGVAESAGVKTLVLTHIVPGNTPVHKLLKAQKGFSGELIVGEDLMQIGIGRPRRRQQI